MITPADWNPRSAHYRRPGGPWDGPGLDEQLTDAGGCPDLVVDSERRLSAEEVLQLVASVAGWLRLSGVQPGDSICWQLPNWHDAVILYRACWRVGAVAVPLHNRAGPREVGSLVDRIGPSMLIAAGESAAASRPEAVLIDGPGGLGTLVARGTVDCTAGAGEDPAVVLFTAGTSGEPKGVIHSGQALAYKARLMVGVHGLDSTDAVLMPAPLAHVSGLLNGVLVPGSVPLKTVLMDRWDPEHALEIIEQEQITFMVGPPTFFTGLMRAPGFEPERVESLRLVSSGGAGVSSAFAREASERLGCLVKRTYGSTEAPTITTSHEGDDADRATSTDGRPAGEVELMVVDPESGQRLGADESGELRVRGPELFAGYTDPARTAEAVTDGWFCTGDLATIDTNGWLTIVGRLKDVIIRGGENIATAEVESILEAHPAVLAAVAVGYPDDELGEKVAAFVVTAGVFGLEQCREWFLDQGVARFKTPERVIRLDELPTLAAGKVDRAALRARAADSDH